MASISHSLIKGLKPSIKERFMLKLCLTKVHVFVYKRRGYDEKEKFRISNDRYSRFSSFLHFPHISDPPRDFLQLY
jgi:hypothetical protein